MAAPGRFARGYLVDTSQIGCVLSVLQRHHHTRADIVATAILDHGHANSGIQTDDDWPFIALRDSRAG
jgi:hypothetical protein